MKCLVTGGAGFIGAHLVRDLLELGHTVTVLDDLSGGFRENVPDQVHFVEGSILDFPLIDRLFDEQRFDYVYHLAAYAAEGLSHFIKRYNYNNNLLGSVNLINASINFDVRCFVFTSSIAVYGENQLPMREDMLPQPEDSYGVAKLAVEQELKCSREMFGLDYVIFRPHNVYGEFQNIGDKYRNVIGIFMNQIMQGQPLTIFGDGTQTRAFSYVKPVSEIIARTPPCRLPSGKCLMWVPINPTALANSPNKSARCSASSQTSATWMPAAKFCTPTRTTARWLRYSVPRQWCLYVKALNAWQPGPCATVRGQPSPLLELRLPKTCRPAGRLRHCRPVHLSCRPLPLLPAAAPALP